MTTMSKKSELVRKLHNEDGLSYEKIGQTLGISKQAAYKLGHPAAHNDYFHEDTIRKIKYVGLRDWMLKHRVTVTKLIELCGITGLKVSLRNGLDLRKSSIDAILSITGLTYEECFKEE
jgi:hypothetical protein